MTIPFFIARCPHNWLANGRSCYTFRRSGLTWKEAQHGCGDLAAGSHLADLKTLEELLFVSSHMLRQNNLLMLWTGLNDQQVHSVHKYIFLVQMLNARILIFNCSCDEDTLTRSFIEVLCFVFDDTALMAATKLAFGVYCDVPPVFRRRDDLFGLMVRYIT